MCSSDLEQIMVIELIEFSEPPAILQEAYKQEWPAVIDQAERQDGQN